MSSGLVLEDIQLPQDWWRVQINKQNCIYINVRQKLCSLAPVFELKLQELDRTIAKLKKSIQYNAKNQLLEEDEDMMNLNKEQVAENERVNLELKELKQDLDMKIKVYMQDIIGHYQDEISLLNQVSGQFFQCTPAYFHMQNQKLFQDQNCSDQATENPKLRYYCSVKLNNKEVGRGIAQNKKQSKYLAARQALMNICPDLYDDWKAQYKNGDELQMQVDENIENQQQQMQGITTKKMADQDSSNKNEKQSQQPLFQFQQQQFPQAQPLQQQVLSQPFSIIEKPLNSQINQIQGILDMEEDLPLNLSSALEMEDAQIDDPELMVSKKNLTSKFTPLTIIKSLQDKHKNLSFEEDQQQIKNPLTNQFIFVVTWTLKNKGIVGRAENLKKQFARNLAAQNFLKNLFPPNYTWLQVVSLVSGSKEPLSQIMDL